MFEELKDYIEVCINDGQISDDKKAAIVNKSTQLGISLNDCELLMNALKIKAMCKQGLDRLKTENSDNKKFLDVLERSVMFSNIMYEDQAENLKQMISNLELSEDTRSDFVCEIDTLHSSFLMEETVRLNIEKKSPSKKIGLSEDYSKIYRSSDDKIALGLCGGLAHKFGIQTVIVRAVVLISLFFAVGWLYLVGLFLPKLPTKNI